MKRRVWSLMKTALVMAVVMAWIGASARPVAAAGNGGAAGTRIEREGPGRPPWVPPRPGPPVDPPVDDPPVEPPDDDPLTEEEVEEFLRPELTQVCDPSKAYKVNTAIILTNTGNLPAAARVVIYRRNGDLFRHWGLRLKPKAMQILWVTDAPPIVDPGPGTNGEEDPPGTPGNEETPPAICNFLGHVEIKTTGTVTAAGLLVSPNGLTDVRVEEQRGRGGASFVLPYAVAIARLQE